MTQRKYLKELYIVLLMAMSFILFLSIPQDKVQAASYSKTVPTTLRGTWFGTNGAVYGYKFTKSTLKRTFGTRKNQYSKFYPNGSESWTINKIKNHVHEFRISNKPNKSGYYRVSFRSRDDYGGVQTFYMKRTHYKGHLVMKEWVENTVTYYFTTENIARKYFTKY